MRTDPLSRLAELERRASVQAALDFFDQLPAVAPKAMIGAWRGRSLPTGHPFDGLLEALGWYGKRFDSTEDAHPLVFARRGGQLFSLDPSLVPLRLVLRYLRVLQRPYVLRMARASTGLLRTDRPKARLRNLEFRGVISATMIYDTLPINDIFRRVDPNTLLGAMDMRGAAVPYFFTLRRDVR